MGSSGGLTFFGKKVLVEFIYKDKHFELFCEDRTLILLCILYIWDPDGKNRHNLWGRVSQIGILRKDSWCVLGDFNDVIHNGERIGGPVRSDGDFEPFVNMLKGCQMT